MIDTIVMTIPIFKEHILDYRVFNPSAQGVFEYPYYPLSRGHFQCFNNPSKLDKEYKPRLTLSKRMVRGGFSTVLKVEFSAPKLLYGNNFDELEESDYSRLITILQAKLLEMKVRVSTDELENAVITGIHYGKNIVLEGIPVSLIIKTIAKMDVSKRLDVGKTDFRNEGHIIRFHTNNYEVSFYDKMKDLKQAKISDKRAYESDNSIQMDLFGKKEQEALEVLRMEVRLNTRKIIRAKFEKAGIIGFDDMKLKDLFSKEIARKILLNHWQDVVDKSLNVIVMSEKSFDVIYQSLLCDGFSKRKAFNMAGALSYIGENSIRDYKGQDKTYYRLRNDLQKVDFKGSYLYDKFNKVKSDVEAMKSLSLSDYQGRM